MKFFWTTLETQINVEILHTRRKMFTCTNIRRTNKCLDNWNKIQMLKIKKEKKEIVNVCWLHELLYWFICTNIMRGNNCLDNWNKLQMLKRELPLSIGDFLREIFFDSNEIRTWNSRNWQKLMHRWCGNKSYTDGRVRSDEMDSVFSDSFWIFKGQSRCRVSKTRVCDTYRSEQKRIHRRWF